MLVKAETLKGYRLDSRDGEIAKVKEFYFDDQYWTIRYLVADTGNWLVGRQVLISPGALGAVNHEEQYISVDLTKKQIEDSPSLETDAPVSRQFEESYNKYQGLPMYWSGPYMWGAYPNLVGYRAEGRESGQVGQFGAERREPTQVERSGAEWEQSAQVAQSQDWDANLRSTHDVSGHHIETLDGDVGHVEDFIIDEETWAIRYLVIDTQNWWPGKKVLISPQWIERVSWDESKVYVNVLSETIKEAPEYTESSPLTREYEAALYHHYDRHEYWATEPAAEE